MSIQHFDYGDPSTLLPRSVAVKAGGFVFVSGQTAKGDDGAIVEGGIEEHTRQVMHNVQRALGLAGCTLADVVKVTVWLQDAANFARFNDVYRQYFPGSKPA